MNKYWQNKLAQGVCLLVGAYAASILVAKFAPPINWGLNNEVPVEFALADGQQDTASDEKVLPQRLSLSTARFPVDFPTPRTTDLMQQTPLPSAEDKALPSVLAPLSPTETLPKPPTVGEYPEERYGDTLVFQITVNEHNLIVDSELKVPSFDGLNDVAIVTGAFGQRVKDVFPPIAQGELRKIDIRMQFDQPFKDREAVLAQQRRLDQGLPLEEKFTPPDMLLP